MSEFTTVKTKAQKKSLLHCDMIFFSKSVPRQSTASRHTRGSPDEANTQAVTCSEDAEHRFYISCFSRVKKQPCDPCFYDIDQQNDKAKSKISFGGNTGFAFYLQLHPVENFYKLFLFGGTKGFFGKKNLNANSQDHQILQFLLRTDYCRHFFLQSNHSYSKTFLLQCINENQQNTY